MPNAETEWNQLINQLITNQSINQSIIQRNLPFKVSILLSLALKSCLRQLCYTQIALLQFPRSTPAPVVFECSIRKIKKNAQYYATVSFDCSSSRFVGNLLEKGSTLQCCCSRHASTVDKTFGTSVPPSSHNFLANGNQMVSFSSASTAEYTMQPVNMCV